MNGGWVSWVRRCRVCVMCDERPACNPPLLFFLLLLAASARETKPHCCDVVISRSRFARIEISLLCCLQAPNVCWPLSFILSSFIVRSTTSSIKREREREKSHTHRVFCLFVCIWEQVAAVATLDRLWCTTTTNSIQSAEEAVFKRNCGEQQPKPGTTKTVRQQA